MNYNSVIFKLIFNEDVYYFVNALRKEHIIYE